MTERFGLGPESLVVEVASNDGYLLKHFAAKDVPVLGIEPTANTAEAARAIGRAAPRWCSSTPRPAQALAARGDRADLMAANNVLAHVPDLNDFVGGFRARAEAGRRADLRVPAPAEPDREGAVRHDLPRALLLPVAAGGGAGAGRARPAGLRRRAAADPRRLAAALLLPPGRRPRRRPTRCGRCAPPRPPPASNRLETYDGFAARVEAVRESFLGFLRAAQGDDGKAVAAYGAAAKGNTFLNYCGATRGRHRLRLRRQPGQAGPLPARQPHPDPARRTRSARLRPDYVADPALEPEGRDHRASSPSSATGAAASSSPRPRREVVGLMRFDADRDPRRGAASRPSRTPTTAACSRACTARTSSPPPASPFTPGPDQPVAQPDGRHPARHALPGRAARRDQAGARDARPGLRRGGGPAPRQPDLPPLGRRRSCRPTTARALFIPEGVAHGFLTLEPDTDVLYQIAPAYTPGHDARRALGRPGLRHRLAGGPALISARDAAYPDHR